MYYCSYADTTFPLDDTMIDNVFGQRPPEMYHVEEGQEIAILPCSKINDYHDRPIAFT